MSNGSKKNYKVGNKNQYRRWIWNRIKESTVIQHGNTRNCSVVFLPGPQELDRPEAVRRGFQAHNLIGVEKNKVALSNIRKNNLTIDGDFLSAVWGIAEKQPVDVVFGDFCGDLTLDFLDKLSIFFLHPNLHNTTFAFNFQRGSRGLQTLPGFIRKFLQSMVTEHFPGMSIKHRGVHTYIASLLQLSNVFLRLNEGAGGVLPEGISRESFIQQVFYIITGYSYNIYYEYPSICNTTTIMFDSVVFTNPLGGMHNQIIPIKLKSKQGKVIPMELNMQCVYDSKLLKEWLDNSPHTKLDEKTLRSTNAIMAHRTRRLMAAP